MNIEYTHELFAEDTKYYLMNEDFTSKIKNYFEEIYDINHVIINGAVPSIKVHGMVHLYGFKIEDGGFYDVFNEIYYEEGSKLLKNSNIIPKVFKKESFVEASCNNKKIR